MKEQIRKAIAQFWEGKLSKEEQRKLLSDLDDEQLIGKNELEREFGSKEGEGNLNDAEEYQWVLDRIHRKMGVLKDLPNRRFCYKRWVMVASWICIIGVSTYAFLINHSTPLRSEKQASIANDTLFLCNDGNTIKYFKMPDGSRIALSPASKLYYTSRYGQLQRQLTLSGEARFTVAHDSLHPFVVTANGYKTTALGTEFIINTHVEKQLSVKLLTGKVVVHATAKSVLNMEAQYLSPGDELQIDESHKSFTINKPKQSVQRANGMKRRKPAAPVSDDLEGLSFEQTSLQRVFATIAREKQVWIDTANAELNGKSFTGSFSSEESLEVILDIICRMNELSYRFDGQLVMIENKPTETLNPTEELE